MAARLETLGSGLGWLPGDPLEELPRLARTLGASAVVAHGCSEPAARALEWALARALPCPLRLFSGETLTERVRTGTGGMFRVFTAFYKTFMREAFLERPARPG